MRKNKMKYGLRGSAIVITIFIFISLLSTSLVTYNSEAVDEEKMYGGTLKVAIIEEPSENIMPLSATSENDLSLVDLMYDSLAIRDIDSGKMIPWLAEDWRINDRNVTVELKEDVTFWDGTELTESDVIYSYNNYEGQLSTPIENMTSVDDYSVRFTLSENNPAFFMTEGMKVPIVKDGDESTGTGPFTNYNKETVEYNVEDELVREATDRDIENTELNLVHDFVEDVTIYETVNDTETEVPESEYDIDLSTGQVTSFPYTSQSTITADYTYSMTYCNVTTNEDYFKGRAYIDGVSFKLYNTIATQRAQNYLGADITGPAEEKAAGAIYDLAKDNIDMIKPVYPKEEITFIDATYSSLSTINKNEFVYAAYNADSKPLKVGEHDVTTESATEFRKGMDLIYNRDNVVDNIVGGMGYTGATTVSPADSRWFNPNINSNSYDTSKANEMMDKAGYFDRDGDGWKELPNGSDFGMDVLFTEVREDSTLRSIGSSLSGDPGFNAIYVESEGYSMDYEDINANESVGNFDVSINRYQSSFDPGRNMYDLFHSDGEENFINFTNSEFEEAIEETNSIIDPEERTSAVQELQKDYMKKIPMSIIYFPSKYHVYRNDFYTGWKEGFDEGVNNKQNFISVHKNVEESLDISIISQDSLESESSNSITITVNDQSGLPVSDVTVTMSSNLGTISPDSVKTDSTGQARVTYNAPEVEDSMKDVVISASATKGTQAGESFSTVTVHPSDVFFTLDVDISADEIESSESTDVEISFDQELDEYPSITLSIIPSTSSVWLEDYNNIGNEGQTFTTTLHTEDVKTDIRARVKAEASTEDFTNDDDDRLDVKSMEASSTDTSSSSSDSSLDSSGEMMLYAGAGALLLVILIIIIAMFMMKKREGKPAVETTQDANFFDEGESGFFYDEKEEIPQEEEETFDEEEEEVAEEDIFEEDEEVAEEETPEDEIFEEEETSEDEVFEEDEEDLFKEEEVAEEETPEDEIFEGEETSEDEVFEEAEEEEEVAEEDIEEE